MKKLLAVAVGILLGTALFGGWAQAADTRMSVAVSQSYDPANWTVVGSNRHHLVLANESLLEIARDHGLGYREITAANPDLDPILPPEGTRVLLPGARILPDIEKYGEYRGIIINLAEKRLYYFYRLLGEEVVISFPVGIGAEYGETPVGEYLVTAKFIEPEWTVPPSIRQRRPDLPRVIPPGPDNPMGSHAIQLSQGSYYIHGTNRPWSIGRRVTSGCIRLYPEDIPVLFRLIEPGTPVRIVNQPIKAGIRDGLIYLEAHPGEPLSAPEYARLLEQLQDKKKAASIDLAALVRVLRERRGTAEAIGTLP